MTIDQIINLLAAVTLFEMMVAIGLGVTFADVARVGGDWRLVGKAALANYVCVPAVAAGLLLWFQAHSPPPADFALVAAGFLIPAVCPGAPYGPPFTGMARGDVTVAVGLMVILAASSAVLAPLLLSLLLPVTSGDQPLQVDAGKMVGTLLLAQFLPLCLGLAVRRWRPALAERLKSPADRASVVLNLALFGLILTVQFKILLQIRLIGYVGMLALVAASAAAGWLLGGPGRDRRTALTMATSVRNVGVGLVIATASFAGTAAVTATTAFALFQTIVMALVALAWGRLASAAGGAPTKEAAHDGVAPGAAS
jgi:BASS family bile acid:Na+ symporter